MTSLAGCLGVEEERADTAGSQARKHRQMPSADHFDDLEFVSLTTSARS